ncbi:MAG: cupin domain-containing protein [Oscillospiraceae bacterium]|nr:cupin domain-containing protein [Oscillospiraceae bacterium]
MSYKVTKANEAYTYTAARHVDCRTTRLHDPKDVNDGMLTCGLTHFLPAGGVERGSNPMESIYYIIEGEMTVYIDGQEYLLKKGDSIHFGPDTEREVTNTGIESTQMLVVLYLPPK